MKKKGFLVTAILVILLGGYLIFNRLFPILPPIEYPSIEDITSISVSSDANEKNNIYGTNVAKTIIHISNSKPTRTMSVHESPLVRPYYKIEVLTSERTFHYYVYKQKDKVYIESPYEGVYITDNQILEIISEVLS